MSLQPVVGGENPFDLRTIRHQSKNDYLRDLFRAHMEHYRVSKVTLAQAHVV